MTELLQNEVQQISPTGLRLLRRLSAAAARVPWASVLFGAGFLVVIVAAGVWLLAAQDAGATETPSVAGGGQLDALAAFFLAVYRSANFQVLVAMLLVGSLLEAIIPGRRQRQGTKTFNIPFGSLMLLFDSALAPLPIFIVIRLADRFDLQPWFDISFATRGSIALSCLAVLTGIVITDFFQYWFHRAQHWRVLWQQHAVHHSDVALNVMTTQRAHFLDHMFLPIAMTVPMSLLFKMPTNDIILLALVPSVWPYVIHMNVRVGFGPLWWLFTSPQYHRIHHSPTVEHRDRNFCLWVPLWDVVFGTAYAPRPGEYPETGVPDVAVSTIPGAILHPFRRWYAMAAGAFAGRGAADQG